MAICHQIALLMRTRENHLARGSLQGSRAWEGKTTDTYLRGQTIQKYFAGPTLTNRSLWLQLPSLALLDAD